MRFIYYISLLTILIISSANSKNINIQDINFDVPQSHIYIEYTNDEVEDFFQEFMNSANIKLYLMGPKKYVDLERAILNGEDVMNNQYAKSIMKKMEKKNFKDEVKASKWVMSEVKKIMKKEKIDFISYVIFSDQNLKKTFSDNDFSGIIDELNQMNSSELAEQTKEIRKMITSLSGNNKSIPINDDMTINLSKFKISKNKNNQLYLRSAGDFIYIFGPMRLDIDLNLFLTEHNDKAIMLISACYVNCSKFNSKFDKMKKNSFNNIKINKANLKDNNEIKPNIIKQLEELNKLYKIGVLSEDEFKKAKKKILN